MSAPDELFCWEGDWGLPSVDPDCLVLLAYAKFAGAPLKVQKISNPWRSPSGSLPALRTSKGEVLSRTSDIIIHLRKQKYNADYDLSAREGADTLAFSSLLEERLLPALIHTFWMDSKNYVELTRRWYAEHLPFPLSLVLPGRMQAAQQARLRLARSDEALDGGEELEKEALPRRGRVYEPAVPAPRHQQVLLRRLPLLAGRGGLRTPGPPAEGQAAQRQAAAAAPVPGQPDPLLLQHPAALLPRRRPRERGAQGVVPGRGGRLRPRAQQAPQAAPVGADGGGRHAGLRPVHRPPVRQTRPPEGAGGRPRPDCRRRRGGGRGLRKRRRSGMRMRRRRRRRTEEEEGEEEED